MSETRFQENRVEILNFDLREFLKIGNKISTRFITGSEWVTNILTDVRLDTFEIHLKVNYVVNNISKGDAMAFKYSYDNVEYVLKGTVEDINLYENLVTVYVDSVEHHLNRRQEPRFDVSFCGYVLQSDIQKPVYALVKNISRTGISLECKTDMDEDSVFKLDIFLSRDKIISMKCKALRKSAAQGTYLYDAAIESLDKNSSGIFEKLFSILLEYDDEVLFNYIASLNKQ